MMKKELAREWVEALRSGEYKQTDGYLGKQTCDGTAFCCLGVLSVLGTRWDGAPIEIAEPETELDGQENAVLLRFRSPDDSEYSGWEYEESMLPHPFSEWLGWEHEDSQADYSFWMDEDEERRYEDYLNTRTYKTPQFEVSEKYSRMKTEYHGAEEYTYQTGSAQVSINLAMLNDAGFTFDQIADIIAWAEGIDR